MQKNNMDGVNEDQFMAITHVDGPMMVLAGPGTGKTFVITRRLRYLCEDCKIPGENILVITFTKPAATEMQERFDKLMGDKYYPVTFGTFHAIYYHILRSCPGYGDMNIVTEKEKRIYLKTVIDNLGLEGIDSSIREMILGDISKVKNDGSDPFSYSDGYLSADEFASVYESYSGMMKSEKKIDFDDMVLECYRLLSNDKKVLSEWRENYKYILIDEFQDINRMQFEVIRMIAAPSNNLFIVGDDDQSIYGFRGSEPGIMLGFPDEYKDCKKVNLKNNYRSTADILGKASTFIKLNEKRFDKQLISAKGEGNKVSIQAFKTVEEQYNFVLKIISTAKRTGSYRDVALIFRTNMLARAVTQILAKNKIPYYFKDKPRSFTDHFACGDILAIMRFANGENTRENFYKFMNKPVRYISRELIKYEKVELKILVKYKTLKPYLRKNIQKLIWDLERVGKMEPYAAINYIRKGMGYENWLMKYAKENKYNIEEINEVLDMMSSSAMQYDSYEAFMAYIEDYKDMLDDAGEDNPDEDRVTIITMHSSKGLEYKTVILPDLNEGLVPQAKARRKEEIEEERRVFYVAMTRAKENLFLTYPEKKGDYKMSPSRFLREIK